MQLEIALGLAIGVLYHATNEKLDILPLRTHLQMFFKAHPLISATGRSTIHDLHPPQPTPPSNNLVDIKKSLQSLSRAIKAIDKKANNNSKPKAPQKTVAPPSNSKTPTYSAIAASRPSCPSIVVDLSFPKESTRPRPSIVTEHINSTLSHTPHHQVHISATHWTAKGNLVVTGGPNVTALQLQNATHAISKVLADTSVATNRNILPTIRANVRWSKLLINGIPTGKSEDREPYNPEECHAALIDDNPSYASLTVTQQPSWVHSPSSYSSGSHSSLVVAFKDQDGSKLKALLAGKVLYAFGTRATLCKWKQHTHKSTTQSPQPPDSDEDEEEEEVEIITSHNPTPEAGRPGQHSIAAANLRAQLSASTSTPQGSKTSSSPQTQVRVTRGATKKK
jgi:hypothetical protein